MSAQTIEAINEICQKWLNSEDNNNLTSLLEKAKIIDQSGLDKELQIEILKNNLKKLDNDIQELQPGWQITNEQLIQISEITKRIKELGGRVDEGSMPRLYNINRYVE